MNCNKLYLSTIEGDFVQIKIDDNNDLNDNSFKVQYFYIDKQNKSNNFYRRTNQ